MVSTLAERIREAAGAIDARSPGPVRLAVVLGSGLGASRLGLADAVTIPYGEIPNMPRPTVPGHAGEMIVGTSGRSRIAILCGRVHLYEGLSVQDVTFEVRAGDEDRQQRHH